MERGSVGSLLRRATMPGGSRFDPSFSRGELLGSPRSRDGFSVGLGNLVSPEGITHRPILLYPLRPDLFAQELDPTATVHRSVEGDTHTHTHTHTQSAAPWCGGYG